MSSINHVILMGNLTRDPELRRIPSGTSVADIGLAVSDQYKDKEGNTVERPLFVEVVTWGRQAETCAEYLRKGRAVAVEGRLQLDQWETDKGEKRSKLRVRAHRVQFLGRASDKTDGDSSSPSKDTAPVEEEVPF